MRVFGGGQPPPFGGVFGGGLGGPLLYAYFKRKVKVFSPLHDVIGLLGSSFS